MIPVKFKVAMGQLLLLVTQLQVFFVRQEMEITSLTKQVQEYKDKFNTEERRSEQLDSSVKSLKQVIEDNNTRIKAQQDLQAKLKTEGQIQKQEADAQSKVYQAKIESLLSMNTGGTECEKVFGLLDQLQ